MTTPRAWSGGAAPGWFAENQPFTPIMDLLWGLLLGEPIGDSGWLSVTWCVAIALVGYLWAKRLYDHEPAT